MSTALPSDKHIIELLEEMVELTRFLALREARHLAKQVLDNERKRTVFSLTNGQRTTRKIAEIAKINRTTISIWWQEWHALGLVEAVSGTRGTRRAIFSPDDLGL